MSGMPSQKSRALKMCQAYRREYGFNAISLMPTNLYGPGDNFDLQNSHVLPALIRKFHEAKTRNDPTVTIWGTGTPRREFLHVDDLADAILYLLQSYDAEPIVNIGWGEDVTIRELAEMVMSVIGYRGELDFRLFQAGWHASQAARCYTCNKSRLAAPDFP